MRHFLRWPLAGGAALLFACGCAGGPAAAPLASGSDHPERVIEVDLVADRSSPWGRTRASAANDEVEAEAAHQAAPESTSWFSGMFGKKTPEKPATPPKTTRSTRRSASRQSSSTFDEETREYLEHELRDATPSERETLYQELQGQDPQMVRRIIKSWKMTNTLRQRQHNPDSAPPDADYASERTSPRNRRDYAGPANRSGYGADEPPPTRRSSDSGSDDPWRRSESYDDRGAPPRSNRTREGRIAPAEYTDNRDRDSYPPPSTAGSRTSSRRSAQSPDYAAPPSGSSNQYGGQGYESGSTRSWSLAPEQGSPPMANAQYNSRSSGSQYRNSSMQNRYPANGYQPREPLNANAVNYSGDNRTARNPVQLWPNPDLAGDQGDQIPPGQGGPLPGPVGPGGNRLPDQRRNLGNLVPGQYQTRRNFLDPNPNYGGNPANGFAGQPGPGLQNTNYDTGTGAAYGGNPQLPVWGQGNQLQQPPNGLPAGNGYGTPPNNQPAANPFLNGPQNANPFAQPAIAQYPSGQLNPIQRAAWQTNLQQVIDTAAAQTAGMRVGSTEQERQAYIEAHVHLRMLYLMSGQQERALAAIPGLDPADQEFWQQVFWGVSNYFDTRGISRTSDRASQVVAQLTAAVQQLQSKANLELRNVSFCQKISSFGNYERFIREEFTPGQPVLLYAEVQNFRSEPTPAGQYRTVLRSVVEFYKPGTQGELLDRIEFNPTEDICRNFRRDYFHSYEFAIPAKLSLGPHVMKLTVEDQLSHRVATYTLNFTVH